MKKGLISLGALLALSLASCNQQPKVTDKVAPEITGQSDKICQVDEEVNLLSGIKALDDVDGDLSASVTVTCLPALTVKDGKVKPAETGEYEIQYKVLDKAGNVGEAFATLTVNPKLAEKVVYKDFNFGETEDNPFFVDSFDGLEVASEITKGQYVVRGKSDNEAWHIKFAAEMETKVADYEVTYEFNSNVNGNVTFEAYDCNANKTAEIHKGHNKVTFKFAGVVKEKQGFCLQLGALPTDFEIGFINVEIAESVGEDVWENQTKNFKFNDANVCSSVFDNNSTGTLTTTEDTATLNITRGSDENGVWQTKLLVKSGIDLKKDTKYRISVDVEATNAIDNFEICYNQGDVEKDVGALYSQSVLANTKKTFEITVTPDANKDNLVLLFQLGSLNTPQGSNVVKVSNLKVEKIVLEDTVVVENHEFTSTNIGSHFWSESAGTFEASSDGKKAIMNITKGTTTPNCWEIWAVLGFSDKLEGGKKYKISVDVKSSITTPEDKSYEAVLRTFNQENTQAGAYGLKFSAGETTKVEFEVELAEDLANPAINFQIGAIQEAAVLEFSNLSVVALGGVKETKTKGYTFTPVGFGAYNDPTTAEGYLYTENGKLVYEMKKIGLVDWHNKMYIPRLTLEADKIYTIEVKAKADKNISCAFFLNPVGKWDPRVSEEIAFETTSKTYEIVTPKFAADMDFEVLFQFGSDVNSALGSAKIEFESITIYSQDVA